MPIDSVNTAWFSLANVSIQAPPTPQASPEIRCMMQTKRAQDLASQRAGSLRA